MFFIICLILTTYILYNSIYSINTTYNQIKKTDIFLADSGNNFYPESEKNYLYEKLSNNDLSNNDLSNDDLSNNDLSNNDLSNNDNYHIYNINDNCYLCYIMGLNEKFF